MELIGAVAVVVGAGGGIGRSICQSLSDLGATVVGTDCSPASLEAMPEEHGVQGFVVDARSRAEVQRLVAEVTMRFGVPGMLVNCLGSWQERAYDEITDSEWHEVLGVNLQSVFTVCTEFLPAMCAVDAAGAVINFASIAGEQGSVRPCSHYAAAKGGVIAYSKSLAREVAAYDITVNVVSPGPIATPMTATLTKDRKAAIAGTTLVKRLGTSTEVAGAVSYLASTQARFVTGEVLRVNGGSLL